MDTMSSGTKKNLRSQSGELTLSQMVWLLCGPVRLSLCIVHIMCVYMCTDGPDKEILHQESGKGVYNAEITRVCTVMCLIELLAGVPAKTCSSRKKVTGMCTLQVPVFSKHRSC